MADLADKASDYLEEFEQRAIDAVRADIPKGNPGDCEYCGEWSGRLIDGACAPCRDKYRLG